MWLISVAQVLAIVAAGNSPDIAAGSNRPQPIQTRQTYFAIPFEVEQLDHPTLGAAEIQLYVSRDRGATWQHENSVTPTTRYFLFRAGVDGEYWFAVRTRDRAGNFRPPQIEAPGLCVVVDTQAPGLAVEAQRGQSGEIVARWRIEEPNIDAGSFKIQYRVGESREWETVAIDAASLQTGTALNVGDATWWTPAGPGRIEIRAEVSDVAGNRNVSHAQVTSVASPAPAGTFAGAAFPPPAPSAVDQAPAGDWRPSEAAAGLPWNPESHENTIAPYSPVGYGTGSRDTSATAAYPPAAGQSYPPAASQGTESAPWQGYNRAAGTTGWERPSAGAGTSAQPPSPNDPVPPPNRPQTTDMATTAYGSVAAQPAPAYQNRYVPGGLESATRPAVRADRVVASQLFEIDYAGPPGGVGRVELWGTRNGGRSWASYGFDTDSRSPMVARVPEEGIYGFKVVFHPMQGEPARPPLPGDAPDITIRVDLTKPDVRLLGVDRVEGVSNRLTIRWQASDVQLSDMPVSLYYADASTGQWRPIARNLRNQGHYDWTLPPGLPPQIQIRLDVQDIAGNVATAETRNPIPLAAVSPPSAERPPQSVHIQGVRPVGQSDSGPQRYFIR